LILSLEKINKKVNQESRDKQKKPENRLNRENQKKITEKTEPKKKTD
jgi:hypothetical protein